MPKKAALARARLLAGQRQHDEVQLHVALAAGAGRLLQKGNGLLARGGLAVRLLDEADAGGREGPLGGEQIGAWPRPSPPESRAPCPSPLTLKSPSRS